MTKALQPTMLRLTATSVTVTGGHQLLGGKLSSDSPFFLCDCRTLETKPLTEEQEPSGQTSDKILAVAFSSSGKYCAVTDDRKRLILFQAEPSWEKISVRFVSRRCTAIAFSPCESRILVADKSGDVYSFLVDTPLEEGHLELGHLSMLLDVVVTPDGRFVITCDRDEKIRVSLSEAPHIIQSFCLGHTEFVSQLLVLPGSDNLLLSGSGDGTLRLWRYDSGEEIHCWTLSDVPRLGHDREVKMFAVSKLTSSPDVEHVAVLCDSVSGIFLFSVSSDFHLAHPQYISLPYVPLDVDFESSTSLWVLADEKESPVELYGLTDGVWQPAPQDKFMKRLAETIQDNWEGLEESKSSENKFSGLYKTLCDNMASYMVKKEARLQAEKRKFTSLQSDSALKAPKI
ncbi:tRNA (guanine-N(7)-)-methyltransferase non-catalytic subunit WDR4 isoform X2 [Hyperolius riggenbachi]|uniref:tRNA (guanine-N(7)-)-methyltransferase non-catalytic subunit WDR4 isoform X2 n=1 Tax=Hyperolius riggenbachi TaxID=752182 RepID=UPI0035A320E7